MRFSCSRHTQQGLPMKCSIRVSVIPTMVLILSLCLGLILLPYHHLQVLGLIRSPSRQSTIGTDTVAKSPSGFSREHTCNTASSCACSKVSGRPDTGSGTHTTCVNPDTTSSESSSPFSDRRRQPTRMLILLAQYASGREMSNIT